MTSCSVTRNDLPVRFLCISDARRADSTRASRERSLLREAAMYALVMFSVRTALEVQTMKSKKLTFPGFLRVIVQF